MLSNSNFACSFCVERSLRIFEVLQRTDSKQIETVETWKVRDANAKRAVYVQKEFRRLSRDLLSLCATDWQHNDTEEEESEAEASEEEASEEEAAASKKGAKKARKEKKTTVDK